MSSFFLETKTYFHKFRTLVFVLFLFFMTATFSFFATSNPIESSAVSTAGFKPGNIISDAVMANYNSMTVAEIQAFLTNKNPCNNRDYNAYVQQSNQYPSVKWHWTGTPSNGHFVCISEERFGDGTVIGEGQTAAEIIYNAAQDNKINPQVLLVLLEKEQSLISDPIPHSGQYRAATGYGCPDTAACDSKYYGFKNQVYRAAELFRYTLDHGYYAYPEKTRGVYVAYNPSSSCGRSEVYIENRATAALYRYTPYQPNAAALNAGFGMGDSCSAYGNRNFYLYFTQWFGSTQAAVDGEQIIIPDGEYSLSSGGTGEYNLSVSGSNAQLTTVNLDDRTQRWQFKRDVSTGYYTINNVYNGRALSASSTEISSGANAQVSYAGSCASQWKVYRTSDNYLALESACSNGMVLGVENGASSHGANVNIGIAGKIMSQKWSLRTGSTLDDGLYVINSAANPQKSLDIIGGYQNGQNIALFTLNKRVNQLWYFEYDRYSDAYLIKNPYSGKYLDLNTAVAKSGQNVQLWSQSNSCAQKWKVVPSGENYNLISTCAYGFSLDIASSSPADNVNVQLDKTSNSDKQKWNISKIQPVLESGNYSIESETGERLVIDIDHASTANGANILVWANNKASNQIWRVEYDSYLDTYSFRSIISNNSLDLNTAVASNGQNIQTWSSNTSCAQRWRLVEEGADLYSIRSYCDEFKTIDIYGGYTQLGTNIILWAYNGQSNQKWSFAAQ